VSHRREPVRLEVTAIAPGGDGLAHVVQGLGRRAVFVPRSAPGDVLEADVDFTRKPARGRVLRVLQPSSMRVPPPCPFVDRCGGCDLMHLALEAQQQAHLAIVRAALERAAGPVRPIAIHPPARGTGYRTRARLAVVARRDHVIVGYRRTTSHTVQDIASCLVLDPSLDAVLAPLRGLFAGEHGQADVSVALGLGGKPVVELRWRRGDPSGPFFASIETIVNAGQWAGAEVWLPEATEPARIGDPRPIATAADGEPLVLPSGGFSQANQAMNETLGQRVLVQTRPAGQAMVELFAGSGNFTVLLARHAASLVAVESDGRAAAAARANLAARHLRARVIEADADAYVLPPGTRTVLLDPPRAGAAGASRRLTASKARRVVYVSCDVPTLARDVEILVTGGFRLADVEIFEMFPHTSHVEILAVLERPRGAEGRG